MTVGGDRLDSDGEPNSPVISLLNTNIFLNSVISDAGNGTTFSTAEIKNHCLQSPMEKYQYMKILLKYFTPEIYNEYYIHKITHNGYINIEIRKGIYGLKEAGILAYNYIVNNLAPFGYHPVKFTPGLWKYETISTIFTLYVDNFSIESYSKDDNDHLLNALRTKYEISIDPKGENYIGLQINWNYKCKHIDISMPGYVQKALQKFLHEPPPKLQHAPH